MKSLEKKVKELSEQQNRQFDVQIFKYFYNKFYFSGCNLFLLAALIVDNFKLL